MKVSSLDFIARLTSFRIGIVKWLEKYPRFESWLDGWAAYKIRNKKFHEERPWVEPFVAAILNAVVVLAISSFLTLSNSSWSIAIVIIFGLAIGDIVYYAFFSSYATKDAILKAWMKTAKNRGFMKRTYVVVHFDDSINITRTSIERLIVVDVTD